MCVLYVGVRAILDFADETVARNRRLINGLEIVWVPSPARPKFQVWNLCVSRRVQHIRHRCASNWAPRYLDTPMEDTSPTDSAVIGSVWMEHEAEMTTFTVKIPVQRAPVNVPTKGNSSAPVNSKL